jgi:regulator of protease activity HflC (stomatin/prohibitin superfamily)
MLREREVRSMAGLPMLVFLLVAAVALPAGAGAAGHAHRPALAVALALVEVLVVIALGGFFMVAPNEGRVLQLFGRYVGTCKQEGLRWANPFYSKKRISLRVRNFESARLKVNDLDGNPVEIAAVIVWKVIESARAMFQVDDYQKFVAVQSEAALRNLASRHPYDAHDDTKSSLRGNPTAMVDELKQELHTRLEQAGVEIMDARLSHLAYAPEIAQAMLQRQQAGAIIAARTRIVEGAVGMVEMALARLAEKNIVELDPERKAQMVSNLLVVLCGERAASPVINTGTIYQ